MKANHRLRLWVISALAMLLVALFIRTQLVRRSAPVPLSETSTVPNATSAEPTEVAIPKERHVNVVEVSLAHVAAHFAAQSGRKITVAPEIAGLKLSGYLKINDVDAFLRLLPKIMPVRLEFGNDSSVRILSSERR